MLLFIWSGDAIFDNIFSTGSVGGGGGGGGGSFLNPDAFSLSRILQCALDRDVSRFNVDLVPSNPNSVDFDYWFPAESG